MKRLDGFCIFVAILFAGLLVLDLFVHPGRPATYDGPTHITTMAQFYSSLRAGEFPVRWSGTYGNYGQPLPLYAHQLPSYLGAGLMFLVDGPVIAFNLVALISAILTVLAFYVLARLYVSPLPALVGTLIYNFTAYRLLNLFLRGALPEFMASIWILTSLICLTLFYRGRRLKLSLLGFTASLACLCLTHPLITVMWFLSLILIALYRLYRFKAWQELAYILLSLMTALLISAYYLVPLVLEAKYLIIGHEENSAPVFISLTQLLTETWHYFGPSSHPGPRDNFMMLGLPELLIWLTGLIYLGQRKIRLKPPEPLLPLFWLSCLYLFLALPLSAPVYRLLPFLAEIQFTWRWFALLSLAPPLLLSLILNRWSNPIFSLVVLSLLLALRLPQVYGKNYYQVPSSAYVETVATLHTPNLNPVWMSSWKDYPVKTVQLQIIEGEGKIIQENLQNTTHRYQIQAVTPLKLVDFTFYFPGWQVYVDNQFIPIEFQDMNYRGIITFQIPAGDHQVQVTYKPTKIRFYSQMLSLFGLALILLACLIPESKWPLLPGKN